jgi:hypothetical protein
VLVGTPINTSVEITGIFASAMTKFNAVQPANAYIPIDVTDEGICIEVSFIHSQKAYSPILVTDEGIIKEGKELQL